MKKFPFYSLLITIFLALACNTTYKAENVQYSNYKIQPNNDGNKALKSVIGPYSDSVRKLMNVVIGYNEAQLEKKKNINPLGYFMTDAFLAMAKQKIDPNIDVSFMNSGGIRLPDLPAGAITQGKVFELMPFDNLMVLVKLKGSLLRQYLDTLLANEGIVESGITMQIMDNRVQQIKISGKPLDPEVEYTIVHSDYVINNTTFLKNLNRKTSEYLLRDAIMDYIKSFDKQGKKIAVSNLERLSYVN